MTGRVPYLELEKKKVAHVIHIDVRRLSWVFFLFFFPNLLLSTDLDFLAVDLDGLHGKVDANGVALVFGVRAALEPLYNASFTGTAVADQHNLEQEVEVVLGGHGRDAGLLLLLRR